MNRNIMIIIAVVVAILLIWHFDLIPMQIHHNKTTVTYLDRDDLTSAELLLLDPILLEYDEGDFIPDSSPLQIDDVDAIDRELEIHCSETHYVDVYTFIDGNKIRVSIDGRPTLPTSCSRGEGDSDWQYLNNLIKTHVVCGSMYSVNIWDFIKGTTYDIDYTKTDIETEPGYWVFTIAECDCGWTKIGGTYEPNCECKPGESVRIDSNTIHRCTDDGTIQGYHESDDAWILEDQPITHAFSTYEGCRGGTQVMKTTHKLHASLNEVIETVDFDLEVTVGNLNNVPIEAEFYTNADEKVETYTGTTPSIAIQNLPLHDNGYVVVTATKDGEIQTKTVDVCVDQLTLQVNEPDTYRYGLDFDFGVRFAQVPSISRPVTLKIHQDGILYDTYEGTMPSIRVTDPRISGDATIMVETDYKGNDYSRSVNVRFDDLNLVITEPSYYEYDHTVHIGVDFQQITVSAPVTIIIRDANNKVLEEYTGTMPQVQLTKPKALSECTIEIRVNHDGRLYTRTLNVFFTGYPIATTVTTKSYVQYEMDNIEFEVRVRDTGGTGLTPVSLSNIQPVATLSQGTVDTITYVHLGEGLYRINAQATGMGTFLGKLQFTYMLKNFESDVIDINIKENKISVGTPDIPPMGIRGEEFEGFIDIFDAKGVRFNPDTIIMTIYYPDGYSTDTMTKDDFTHIGIGHTPTQLEKFTFEVKSQSSGITEGFSSTSMAVASAEGEADAGFTTSGFIVEFILNNLMMVFIAFLVVAVIIWRFVL